MASNSEHRWVAVTGPRQVSVPLAERLGRSAGRSGVIRSTGGGQAGVCFSRAMVDSM